MAKLFNSISEAIALRGLCSRDAKVAGFLMSKLTPEFFHNPESKEVFERITTVFTKRGELPVFRLLCEDLKLSEAARDFLKTSDAPRVESIDTAGHLVEQLNDFRKTRGLYTLATNLLANLNAPKVDVDSLTLKVAESAARITTSRMEDSDILHIGKDSTLSSRLEEMLYGEDADSCVPTGLKTFDERNGGFFRGSLVVIAATSGGGKSLLARQLSENQAARGYKVVFAPLEMTIEENLARTVASRARLNPTDILLKKLASGERDHAWKRMRKLDREIASNNGRLTIFKPREDMTMEALMSAVHSLNSDVVYIDYIGLLAGADGDDQWKKLGQIARFGKIYAENHNKVVVLLCQLSEDGRIRYSQAIKEHASLAWTWTATKDSRDKGYMQIELLKARNQNMDPFTLKVDYAHMSVTDLAPDELSALETEREKKSTQPSKDLKEMKPKTKSSSEDESSYLPDQSS